MVRFLGEQSGESEELLKRELAAFFRKQTGVTRAYLAQVVLEPGSKVGISLCISSVSGADQLIVAAVAEIFSSMFRTSEALEILFLDDKLEREVQYLCKPFYSK